MTILVTIVLMLIAIAVIAELRKELLEKRENLKHKATIDEQLDAQAMARNEEYELYDEYL